MAIKYRGAKLCPTLRLDLMSSASGRQHTSGQVIAKHVESHVHFKFIAHNAQSTEKDIRSNLNIGQSLECLMQVYAVQVSIQI